MKKIFVIFSLTILFLTSFSIYRTPTALGAGEGAVLKIVAGSQADRVLFAVAEKAGMKIATKKAKDKARDRWNMQIHEMMMDQTVPIATKNSYKEFLLQSGTRAVTPVSGYEKAGKVALDSVLFITGLAIVTDGYNSIKEAVDAQKEVDFMEEAMRDFKDSKVLTLAGIGSTLKNYGDRDQLAIGMLAYPGSQMVGFYTVPGTSALAYIVNAYEKNNWLYVDWIINMHQFGTNGPATYTKTQSFNMDWLDLTEDIIIREVPDPSYLPEVPPLPWVNPARETWTLPGDIPEEDLDVLIPIGDPVPDPQPDDKPLNDPLPKKKPVPDPGTNPDPGTTPGDGVKPIEWEEFLPDGNPNPEYDPSGKPVPVGGLEPVPIPGGDKPPIIPEKPPKEPDDPEKPPGGEVPPGGKPGTFWMLLAFIDLLRAIIWYIMRFVTFIVTIPAIPSLPFDNPAFHWVRNSKFLGIYPYAIVMNLATLGLSLSVYKIVRRFI